MKYDRAFGVLVTKNKKILMVRRSGADGWDFPKGHREEGESDQESAIREVAEETGYKIKIIGNKCVTTSYIFEKKGKRVYKQLYFWFGKLVSEKKGKLHLDDSEMEAEVKTGWISFEEVENKIKYKPILKLWKKLIIE